MTKKSYVYIIGSIENFNIVKVGVSGQLPYNARLKQLQTGNPFKLYVWGVVSVSTNKLLKCEKSIHSRLSALRLSGEWFKINPKDAYRIVIEEVDKVEKIIKKGGTAYDAFCGNEFIQNLVSVGHPCVARIFNQNSTPTTTPRKNQ